MSDSRWMDEWMQAWQSLAGATDAEPWTAAFDHFTRSRPAAYPQSLADALTRITGESRAFFELGQSLAHSQARGWQQSVFDYLDELSHRLQEPGAAAGELAGMAPLDYWRRFAGHDDGPPPDQDAVMAAIDQLLRIPGIGHTREHQEDARELSRLWLAYQRAYGDYAAHCTETARCTVERLRDRLTGEFDSGGGPATIRALYDAWVACSEEVFAERTATDEYVKLHGRMINAFMAYRRHASKMLDQWAKAADLPTREELDALHRKLKDTRQELRRLRHRVDEDAGK